MARTPGHSATAVLHQCGDNAPLNFTAETWAGATACLAKSRDVVDKIKTGETGRQPIRDVPVEECRSSRQKSSKTLPD